ncbi:S1 family peptidase [Streptomyces sp. NPDC029006]
MVRALADSLGISDTAAVRRLDSQSRQQTALEGLRSSGVDTRGAFFDSEGRLTVNVTAPDTAREVEAAGLRARLARHSAGELDRVKTALDKYAEINTPAGVQGWGVDPMSDTVIVHVRDTAAAGTGTFLKKARSLGSAVTVRHDAGRAVSTAGIYPGSRMDYGNHYCSVGFGARTTSGQQVLVTAGHCVETLPDLYFAGSHFAKGSTTRFRHGQTSIDMGLATVDAGTTITTQVGTWNNGADIAIQGSRRAAVGSDVCKSGATSHWTCGSIKSYNYSVTYTDPGQPATLVTNLGLSNTCDLGGDSGGAWISGNQGQGMTSGGQTDNQCNGVYGQGTSYFQPLDDTLRYYGLSLNTA